MSAGGETSGPVPIGRPPLLLVAAIAALTVIRLAVAGASDLVDDEAYYRLWSLSLAFGYYDHAPMVAWMIRAGRALVGDGALGVRLFAPLATAAGTFLLWRAVALVDGRETATRAAIWFNAMILVGAGSVLATPDTPAVFFWGATVWALAELTASRNPAWWLVVGVAAGLGLFSKYSVLFLGLGIGLWLVSSRESLRWLKAWQLWLGGAIAAAIFLPVILWNADHEWASFAKQFGRTVPKGWRPEKTAEMIGVQMLLIGLPMVPLIGLGLGRSTAAWRRGGPGAAGAILPIATGVPFVAYLLFHSLHGGVEGNWPGPLYPSFAWLAARTAGDLGGLSTRARAIFERLTRRVAPFGFALTALLYLHVVMPLVVLPPQRDPTAQMRGWDGLAREIEARAKAEGAGWIGAANYTVEGQLAKRLGVERVIALDEAMRWVHLPPPDPALAATPGLVVARADRLSIEDLTPRFGRVTALGRIVRRERGQAVEGHDLFLVAEPKRWPPR